jgi:uncharacterized membrane protein
MAGWFFRRRPGTLPQTVKKNIESIAQLEKEFQRQRTAVDRVSDAITEFAGSIRLVAAHGLAFAAWILLNAVTPETWHFDPYPFSLLGLIVGLEAIFLSTFVLMSQNRQNAQADQWAQVDLQVSLLAEQEMTKALQMLQRIYSYLGLDREAKNDRELKELLEKTHVETIIEQIEKTREEKEKEEAAAREAEARAVAAANAVADKLDEGPAPAPPPLP